MPTQATYDDANLILRLYELRREEKLRKAREWFAAKFNPNTLEDVNKLAPMGSQENAYVRMVTGYWEMAASFVTSGVLNEELFAESNGELLFVWERLRPIVPGMREMFKNPGAMKNMEAVANMLAKRMQSQSPEAYSAFQAMVHGVAAAGQGN